MVRSGASQQVFWKINSEHYYSPSFLLLVDRLEDDVLGKGLQAAKHLPFLISCARNCFLSTVIQKGKTFLVRINLNQSCGFINMS